MATSSGYFKSKIGSKSGANRLISNDLNSILTRLREMPESAVFSDKKA